VSVTRALQALKSLGVDVLVVPRGSVAMLTRELAELKPDEVA